MREVVPHRTKPLLPRLPWRGGAAHSRHQGDAGRAASVRRRAAGTCVWAAKPRSLGRRKEWYDSRAAYEDVHRWPLSADCSTVRVITEDEGLDEW